MGSTSRSSCRLFRPCSGGGTHNARDTRGVPGTDTDE
jgi:hypothetical protein